MAEDRSLPPSSSSTYIRPPSPHPPFPSPKNLEEAGEEYEEDQATKMKMKTKKNTTHQAAPLSIGGEYVFVVRSFFPAPPSLLPRSRLKLSRGPKSAMKMTGGSYGTQFIRSIFVIVLDLF